MKRNNIWLAATLILGGCGAMEQAPLVYSSTKQFGLGVKSGAPEAPGLDVNIGFRALDVAYVPVAVAKKCEKDAGCSPDYNLQRIQGISDQNGRSRVDKDRINALRLTINEGTENNAQRSKRKVWVNAQLAEVADLPNIDNRISALESAPPAAPRVLTAQDEEELARLKAAKTRIAQLNKATLQNELAQLETEIRQTASSVDAAESELKVLLAQREEESGDSKTDALSVYGTFSGDAAGGSNGGGLKLGNTFSTGIAAQFIAQGLKDAAPTKAVGECIAIGQTIVDTDKIPQADKATILAAIATACDNKKPE